MNSHALPLAITVCMLLIGCVCSLTMADPPRRGRSAPPDQQPRSQQQPADQRRGQQQPAAQARPHPRLVFTAEEIPAIRRFAQTEEGRVIRQALDHALTIEQDDGIVIGSHAAGEALLFVLTGDVEHARRSRAIVERAMAGVPHNQTPPLWNASNFKMIYRTKAAVDVALAYDLCYDAWPEDFRQKVAGELARLAAEFLRGGGEGFNRQPSSNWVGNTKAAGGFLALAVRGDPGVDEQINAVANRARREFFGWVSQAFGTRGWPQEGFNYLRYPMTTSGFQYLQALTLSERRDVVRGNHAQWIMPLYITHLVPPITADDPPYLPFFGLSYRFTGRDVTGFEMLYERTRWRSGDTVMALGSASAQYRPAALWTIRNVVGLEGDRTFDIYKPADAIYAMANLARYADVDSRNPGEVLPRMMADDEMGYYVFRNRWRDSNDSVAAFQMNLRPRRATYSFQDAGSFRIYSFGTRWAEQASRKDRDWSRESGINRAMENVVQIPDTNGWPGGRRIAAELNEHGGVLSVDISAAYSRGQRLVDAQPGDVKAVRGFAVDYSGQSGADGLYVVTDRFVGPGEKTWVMHTGGQPQRETDGFSIRGRDGARMRAWVLAPSEFTINFGPGQETRAIEITGGDDFFIVMAVNQDGKAPDVTISGKGLNSNIEMGGQRIRYVEDRVVISKKSEQ
ncbi:MAG: hypothetical protein JJU36_18015 [Phycisphaeraceae bacterium]|nr:hypothetical protein [Phycisphaeraceae bacterium]